MFLPLKKKRSLVLRTSFCWGDKNGERGEGDLIDPSGLGELDKFGGIDEMDELSDLSFFSGYCWIRSKDLKL